MTSTSSISAAVPGRPVSQTLPVEVMGRNLNHSNQGECLRNLLEMVHLGPKRRKLEPQRRVCRRLEPSKVEELIQGYSDGVPVDVLADQFGVDQSTVQNHARRHNLPRRSPRLGPSQTEEAARLYLAGESLVKLPITSVSLPTRSPLRCAGPGDCDHDEGGSTSGLSLKWLGGHPESEGTPGSTLDRRGSRRQRCSSFGFGALLGGLFRIDIKAHASRGCGNVVPCLGRILGRLA